MKVEVTIHESAREQFNHWVRAYADEDRDSDFLHRFYIHELFRILEERHGVIREAECVRSLAPRVYLWRYTEEMSIMFMIKDKRQAFRQTRRRVIITGFLPGHDREADESTLPH